MFIVNSQYFYININLPESRATTQMNVPFADMVVEWKLQTGINPVMNL